MLVYANFRSRDKDGGHTSRSALAERNPATRTIDDLFLIEQELLPIEVLHLNG